MSSLDLRVDTEVHLVESDTDSTVTAPKLNVLSLLCSALSVTLPLVVWALVCSVEPVVLPLACVVYIDVAVVVVVVVVAVVVCITSANVDASAILLLFDSLGVAAVINEDGSDGALEYSDDTVAVGRVPSNVPDTPFSPTVVSVDS